MEPQGTDDECYRLISSVMVGYNLPILSVASLRPPLFISPLEQPIKQFSALTFSHIPKGGS